MNATDILVNEHRVITQMLDCLEKIIEQASAAGRLEEGPAGEAIDFFRIYADRCHRRKEEAHLFPLMQARGLSGNCGPLPVIQSEHELSRIRLDETDEAIERASEGDVKALRSFVQHGQSFIRLVRAHMRKEDRHSFPMANRMLTELDQQNLLTKFEQVDAEERAVGTHEKYLALANRNADRFGVSQAVTAVVIA
jgi:hemerythrin-like domain-containing protein